MLGPVIESISLAVYPSLRGHTHAFSHRSYPKVSLPFGRNGYVMLMLRWIALLIAFPNPLWAAEESISEPISYARQILPLLSDNCFLCHGPDANKRDADLRLDVRSAAIQAGAIMPGDPRKSELIQRIRSTDPDDIMPPPKSHLTLSAADIKLLEDWISQGAKYERHWAFVSPPNVVALPAIRDKGWARNGIDHFVLAKLEAKGLKPTAEATRERWLRRVTFDLTGLPPSQKELDDFLIDQSDKAYEAVVDRLLASPRYGERMAVPWLDLARYADSFGYQADIHTDAWPYRDWVIRAFNRNLPFDEFITEQLAGDLLPDPSRDQKLATAFNRIHRKTNEGGSIAEEFRQDGISDRVNTVGTAFLALTMDCARCHDHKYDPISMREFYEMGSFFNSIDEHGLVQGGQNKGLVLPTPELKLHTPQQEEHEVALQAAVDAAHAALMAYLGSAEAEQAFVKWNQKRDSFPQPHFAAHFGFEGNKPGVNLRLEKPDDKQNAKYGANKLVKTPTGQGLQTNGDDAIRVAPMGINHSEQPMAVSLWLKPGESYERAVVFANTSSFDVNYSGYELLIENGKLRWTIGREFPGCAASVSTQELIPTNQWTHVVVSSDGSGKAVGMKIYLNGILAATDLIKDTMDRDYRIGNAITFGARGRDVGLRGGGIDEITIHRRAITAMEVRALYQNVELAKLQATEAEFRDYFHSAADAKALDLTAKLLSARTVLREMDDGIFRIMTMREIDPVPHYILERGDYTMPGEQVQRETPDWLPPFPQDEPRNRLGFARWLVMPDHPLTSRVTINRIWQEIFGIGIVESSDNFGLQGAQPSHPHLLDWLARDFMQHDWNLKRAIKQMVLSATYRQDSSQTPALTEIDPDNRLLARGPSKRLTAEMIRDSVLDHSGLLVEKIGGPPVKPYQAPGSMWKVLNNFLPEYTRDHGEGLYRRSLYTFWRRTTTPPNMMVFDTPTRDICSSRRIPTNTPLQPMVTLNDPQHVEAGRKFAERILKEGGKTDSERASWAWREVTSRNIHRRQLAVLTKLIMEQREFFKSGSSDATKLLKVGDSDADAKLDPIELATHTALAQALLNLDAHMMVR